MRMGTGSLEIKSMEFTFNGIDYGDAIVTIWHGGRDEESRT